MATTIDKAGRLVIPKSIRDEARLQPGMPLDVTFRDGRVEIEPSQVEIRLERKGRILVAVAPEAPPLTSEQVREVIEEGRRQRDEDALGQQANRS